MHNVLLQAMQDKLVKKVSDLEEKNETLRDHLATKDAETQKVRDEKEELKRKTDAEVSCREQSLLEIGLQLSVYT